MSEHIVVIIGAGGCGLATARRIASKSALEGEGHRVETHQIDNTDSASVQDFAKQAVAAGMLDVVVHTSGVSPTQANQSVDEVLKVNLLGTAHVIDAFLLPYVGPGISVICISSIAVHLTWGLQIPTPALEKHFATALSSQLLENEDFRSFHIENANHAYAISKRANNLRVEGFVVAYGDKGARINSVSPAVVMTKMGRSEMNRADHPEVVDWIRDCGGLKRHATPYDVASAIAFLASREASYITGTDILLDGGSRAGILWNPKGDLTDLWK